MDVQPDQAVATLTAQASSANAATAQNEVNAAMAAALALAKRIAGLTATTANYDVSAIAPDSGNGPDKYQASQDLNLTMQAPGGAPAASFLALLAKLQTRGLLLESLDGDLSDHAQRQAEQAAIIDALHQIQTQAAAIAAALNEKMDRITTLNVNIDDGGPSPGPRPMMMMARAATPPQAAPAAVTVQASVSATIEITK
jgi:uncharacterized protein YggE